MQRWSKGIMAGLLMGGVLLVNLPAAAQSTYDPGIQDREQRQQERIQQGIQSGQLTPKEANRLERQQAHIQATEARMKANGNLSPRERAKLTRMQDRASRDISRKKHNNRTVTN